MKQRQRWPWVLATSLALVAGAFFVALPMYVRERAVATAASNGILLRVGSVSVTPFAVHVRDVGVSIAELPNASAQLDDVVIELSSLAPTSLLISGGRAQIDGSVVDVRAAIERWRAAHPPRPGGGESFTVRTTRLRDFVLSWTVPLGAGSRLDAAAIEATFEGLPGSARGCEITAGSVTVELGGIRFGPWGSRLTRAARASSLDVTLDPTGGRTAVVRLGADEDDLRLDVDVPRAHLSELGIPALALALGGQDPELTAQIHGRGGVHGAHATFAAGLSGARFGGVAARTDVKVAGEWSGDPSHGLELTRGTFAFGPFSGALTGSLLLEQSGLIRADVAFKSQSISCADLVKAAAEQSLGDLGAQLGALAQAAGLAQAVEGAAEVRGTFSYDSSAVGGPRFTLVPTSTCALNFFPH